MPLTLKTQVQLRHNGEWKDKTEDIDAVKGKEDWTEGKGHRRTKTKIGWKREDNAGNKFDGEG